MVEVRSGLSASLAGLVVLLAVLEASPGTGLLGWATGLACGLVLCVAAARCAASGRVESFGPADLVTIARATLSCGVAALVADSFVEAGSVGTRTAIVGIAAVALLLDAVDGRVARLTRTVSGFGARLDGEADAFLMLVLSLYVSGSVVAGSAGAGALVIGVLAIGAMRYLFAMAGWVLPWMAAQLPSAVLAEGGDRDSGDLPGVRGNRRRCTGGDVRRAGHRPGPAARVVRPRRLVAVATPARCAC